MSKPISKSLHPQIKVLDEARGIVEYVASDETLDSYNEVIRAAGWKFDARFTRNPVFVNSHSYWDIDDVLGRVLEWRMEGGKLVETVQWAIDVEENAMARLGFQMTAKGYLKAVSVGFIPVKQVYRNDDEFTAVANEMKLTQEVRDKVRRIYYEQEQIELSACVIGANPSALAKAIEAKAVDADLIKRVGLGGDFGDEVLGLAAEAWENNDDPAIRSLVSLQLLQLAGQRSSAGRGGRGTVSPQPGRAGSGGKQDQSPRETRNWLEQVARGMGLQN